MTEDSFDAGYWESADLAGFGFAAVGKNVRISKRCTIVARENISIGDNVRIDDFALLSAVGGRIEIGSYVHIAAMGYLAGRGGIVLEDFANLSQGVRLYSISDDYSGNALTNPMVPPEYLNVTIAPVHIGRHVILGSGSIVLPGCTLGEGAATGALSLVTRSLDPWGIYAGIPAKLIKPRSQKLLELEASLLALP